MNEVHSIWQVRLGSLRAKKLITFLMRFIQTFQLLGRLCYYHEFQGVPDKGEVEQGRGKTYIELGEAIESIAG